MESSVARLFSSFILDIMKFTSSMNQSIPISSFLYLFISLFQAFLNSSFLILTAILYLNIQATFTFTILCISFFSLLFHAQVSSQVPNFSFLTQFSQSVFKSFPLYILLSQLVTAPSHRYQCFRITNFPLKIIDFKKQGFLWFLEVNFQRSPHYKYKNYSQSLCEQLFYLSIVNLENLSV